MYKELKVLIDAFFSDKTRVIKIKKGETFLKQGIFNDRLFFVKEGEFVGYIEGNNGERELFRIHRNQFLGVYSFFSKTFKSSATVVAVQDSTVSFIDQNVKYDIDHGEMNLFEQFMPVVVENLLQRQKHEIEIASEKEQALKMLKDAERLSSLGQMAAGIAHELNNAISVFGRNCAWMRKKISELIDKNNQQYADYFRIGIEKGRMFSSRQVRQRTKEIEAKYGFNESLSNKIAQTSLPVDFLLNESLKQEDIEELLNFWDMGSAFHDIKIATKHAVHVVKSVRALAEKKGSRRSDVDINESIRQALSLLSSPLRKVEVKLDFKYVPKVHANKGELVQVWLNIIKNGMESLTQEKVKNGRLSISTYLQNNKIVVTIEDNGPGIPNDLLPKIWQPDVTTKEKGIAFGLGLGLTIVERIVKSYNGDIGVKSRPGKTVFTISMPIL
ncbi:cyclic nucleotide-binding domain-containing protein [bacterium]|nr:cyclic nucleotide-binding domain-containing protein [bacterium]